MQKNEKKNQSAMEERRQQEMKKSSRKKGQKRRSRKRQKKLMPRRCSANFNLSSKQEMEEQQQVGADGGRVETGRVERGVRKEKLKLERSSPVHSLLGLLHVQH